MMRDRLSELAARSQMPATDLEMAREIQDDSGLTRFLRQVQDTRDLIDVIATNTRVIEACYTTSLGAATESQITEATREAQDLVAQTNKLASRVNTKIKGLKTEIPDQGSVEGRIRTGQHAALSNRFKEVMAEYHDVQIRYKTKVDERLERQFRIIRPEATQEEMDTALKNHKGQLFSQAFMAVNQRAEAKKAFKDIQDRHLEILKLEESLRELAQLFSDMQMLVESQGQMLDTIEQSVDKAADYTAAGVGEMRKVLREQKKSRKKMCILVCCLIILLLVILIPTLIVFLPRH